jgi:hypothetical protein
MKAFKDASTETIITDGGTTFIDGGTRVIAQEGWGGTKLGDGGSNGLGDGGGGSLKPQM